MGASDDGPVRPWFYCVACQKHGMYATASNALIGAQAHADKMRHTVFMGNLAIIEPAPRLAEHG